MKEFRYATLVECVAVCLESLFFFPFFFRCTSYCRAIYSSYSSEDTTALFLACSPCQMPTWVLNVLPHSLTPNFRKVITLALQKPGQLLLAAMLNHVVELALSSVQLPR